jgi:hypothetical protein
VGSVLKIEAKIALYEKYLYKLENAKLIGFLYGVEIGANSKI